MTWTKQRLNNLFFVVGILACVVMLLTFDVSFTELWQHLCHAGYWLIPIVGVWIFIYAINAWSWFTIIRSKTRGVAARDLAAVGYEFIEPRTALTCGKYQFIHFPFHSYQRI